MAVIKSGASSDQWTIDPTSKAGRTTLYDTTGALLGTIANPIQTARHGGRNRVGLYACSTWRTLGTAATPQNIATIHNPSASTVNMAIMRATIQVDSTAALLTVSPSIKTSRATALPTGGTTIPSEEFATAGPSAQGVVLGGTASDGGGATAITATAGNTIWTQLVDRVMTAVGQINHPDNSLLPQFIDEDPLILLPGQALLVQGVTANAATTHFVCNFAWEEYT